jgi:CheY-like chemotaxis protein
MAEERFILFVEDRLDEAELIRVACARVGLAAASYYIAQNGSEAIEYFKLSEMKDIGVRSPDCVLTDLHMPTMNGLELLSWLRSRPRYTYLPVTLVTTGPRDDYEQRARELRCDRFLEKPRSLDGLVKLVQELARECERGS